MTMRVFISYSSKDGKHYAQKLSEILRHHGHDSFFADHDTLPAESIWETIPKECLNRDMPIFVVTPSSEDSKGQKEEYLLIVTSHKEPRMSFRHRAVPFEKLLDFYPCLTPFRDMDFDDENFVSKCEELAVDLVRIQDLRKYTEGTKEEFNDASLPQLSTKDLDSSEIVNCLKNLRESYERETIMPYVCRIATERQSSPKGYVTIGFSHLLPRDFLLPKKNSKTIFCNDVLFQQFGKGIALAERKYLQKQILENGKIPRYEGAFSPEKILSVIEDMVAHGNQPDTVFLTIPQYLEALNWTEEARVKYDYKTSGRVSNAVLAVGKYELQIVLPLGKIQKKVVLSNKNAIQLSVVAHPDQGALFATLGNSELYPTKFAQVVAFTRVKCELDPNGISVIG